MTRKTVLWLLGCSLVFQDGNAVAPADPPFVFLSIQGVHVPGETIPLTLEGHAIPAHFSFAVVFEDSDVTTTVATFTPSTGPSAPSEQVFSVVIPTVLTASDVSVFLSYPGQDSFSLQGLPLSFSTSQSSPIATTPAPPTPSTTTTTPISTSTSTNTQATPSASSSQASSTAGENRTNTASETQGSTMSALTSSSPISGGAAETSSSTASTSTSMASLSSSIPTPSNTTSPSAINSPNPIAAAAKPKEKSLGAIVGGVLGAAVGALVILVALCIWGKRRRRGQLFKRERPATFYGDKMVKSSSEQTPQALESSFERVGAASGLGRTGRHSRSLASSRNSSIDQANEKTPALGAHTRSINSSIFSDDDEDGDSSLRSRSSNIDQSAGLGLGRLSPRTDRQMDLEQRIHDLKAQLISLSDDSAQGGESTDSHASRTLFDIRAKIRRLEGLEHSQWAMELTDEVPTDFLP
ncbi:hypothetical protein D9757_010685 [Collybiopsis confluens]|uniref:Mid2 domain-containing protein n=1 Tax=Collybiopsis confluens TaxID=2823264 RepID=A0A8H5M3B8_9AGAR|nr:hypothetical protein D9757_010685 [Collybiopsis confluens]